MENISPQNFSSQPAPVTQVTVSSPQRRSVLRATLFFIVGLIVLTTVVGVSAYYIGFQQGARQEVPAVPSEEVAEEVLKESPRPVPETENTQDLVATSGTTYLRRTLSDDEVQSLKAGYHTSTANPQLEVFVFADVTETDFSGNVLTYNLDYLLQKYPRTVRAWYLHSALFYRDMAEEKEWSGVIKCLADQDQLWPNMSSVIEAVKSKDLTMSYSGIDQSIYSFCIEYLTQNPAAVEQSIADGQKRMENFDINGVPTILFVSPKTNRAIQLQGAIPMTAFEADLPEIFTDLNVFP